MNQTNPKVGKFSSVSENPILDRVVSRRKIWDQVLLIGSVGCSAPPSCLDGATCLTGKVADQPKTCIGLRYP
ncbi:MAG: hypothetical protein F6K65_31040 [Moorea sp. SIO3C2]|nr:hypothetical protein [Moorena sp. SIO3C2]